MNIQEKAEQYARDAWGEFYHDTTAYGTDMYVGEISAQDYIAGYNEAKRWISVGERIPEKDNDGLVKVVLARHTKAEFPMTAFYHTNICKWMMYGTLIELDVIEWREI